MIRNSNNMLENASVIKQAADIINSGGIISFPTETVYALAVNALDTDAITRLYNLKERPLNKPFAILASNIQQIEEFALIDVRARILLKKYAPGPVTIVINLKKSIFPKLISGNNHTVGVRIPNHSLALSIIEAVGHPIVATSANLSNYESSINAGNVDKIFGEKIDMIIDGGNTELGIESTVIDLTQQEIKLLRNGYVSFQDILFTLSKL